MNRTAARNVAVLALAAALASTACGGPQRASRIHDRGLDFPSRQPTRYFPKDPTEFGEADYAGGASWYGERFHGRTTANGERFDMYTFTAAHRRLPFNTIVRVVRTDDRRSVVVRVNDRGPGSPSRVIDLSWAAAFDIGMVDEGHTQVELEVVHWGDGAVYER